MQSTGPIKCSPVRRAQNLKEQSTDFIKESKEFKEDATNQLDELHEKSKQQRPE